MQDLQIGRVSSHFFLLARHVKQPERDLWYDLVRRVDSSTGDSEADMSEGHSVLVDGPEAEALALDMSLY